MSNQYDYDDEDKDVKKELVIPKYTLLYEDEEIEIKQEAQEDKEDMHDRDEEEKKPEEHVEEGDEEAKNKNMKPIDRIVRYIAEITQDSTDKNPMSDKELAEKLKRRLDLDIDLIRPSVSNEDVEENGVWQVIIGKQFAASVTFDARFIYYFQLDESRKYFLVFRS